MDLGTAVGFERNQEVMSWEGLETELTHLGHDILLGNTAAALSGASAFKQVVGQKENVGFGGFHADALKTALIGFYRCGGLGRALT